MRSYNIINQLVLILTIMVSNPTSIHKYLATLVVAGLILAVVNLLKVLNRCKLIEYVYKHIDILNYSNKVNSLLISSTVLIYLTYLLKILEVLWRGVLI